MRPDAVGHRGSFTSAKDVIFSTVSFCWRVGVSAGLHKIYRMDFHETWMEDVSQPRIDPINIEAFFGGRFFDIFVNDGKKKSGGWYLHFIPVTHSSFISLLSPLSQEHEESSRGLDGRVQKLLLRCCPLSAKRPLRKVSTMKCEPHRRQTA